VPTESPFDIETSVTGDGSGRFTAQVSPAWNIGENPNGGYLMAIAVRAMQEQLAVVDPQADQPDPLTLTAHFLRPGVPGASCTIDTDVLKLGRSITTTRATLVQEGKARVEMLAGFGNLSRPGAEDGHEMTVSPPILPPPAECVDRATLSQGVTLPLLDRVEVRITPEQAELGTGGAAKMAGWIRFADGRPADSMALALFADAYPPSLFTALGTVGWVPTLEMTVHIRRRPSPGWLMATFETDDLAGGRMIETGSLWDADGHLVARSRQLGMLLT
jgi:acyl-CoA thioesterase